MADSSSANATLSPAESTTNSEVPLELEQLPSAASSQRVELSLLSSSSSGASFASSVFNLANTIMGSGLLTLPSAFASAGLLPGVALAIAAAFINVLTLHCLTKASNLSSSPVTRSTFGSVAEAALPGWGGAVIEFSVAAYGTGVGIGYMIVATDSFVDVTGIAVRPLWTLLTMVAVVPLTLLKSIDSLRFTSTFAILALVAVTLVIIGFSAAPRESACAGFAEGSVVCSHPGHDANESSAEMSCPGDVHYGATALMPTARALSKFVLAYGCQQNILPIVAEMRRPTPFRTFAVSACSIGVACAVYVAVATAGYLTFGNAVCSNVINTYPRSFLVAAVRLLVAAVVLTSYPLLAYEARRSILARIVACRGRTRRARSGDGVSAASADSVEAAAGRAKCFASMPSCFVSSKDELLVAAAYVLTTTVVALAVSDLGPVLGLVGASAGMVISFTIPSVSYVMLARGAWGSVRLAALGTLVLSIVLLPVCVGIQFVPE